jgi:predicted metallo-beta-lactamase superfamily hydrolase
MTAFLSINTLNTRTTIVQANPATIRITNGFGCHNRYSTIVKAIKNLIYLNSGKLVLSHIRIQKMNWYEVAKRIKGIIPGTKIITMTALEFNGNICKILRSVKIHGFAQSPDH